MLGFAPLEHDVGLFDTANRCKPAGRRFAELIQSFRKNPPQAAPRSKALILPDDAFSGESSEAAMEFAKQWVSHISNGAGPAIVLQSRSQDKEYLRMRGIGEVIGKPAETANRAREDSNF